MIYNTFVKPKTKNILNSFDDNFRISLLRMDLFYKVPGFFGTMYTLSGKALENKKFLS